MGIVPLPRLGTLPDWFPDSPPSELIYTQPPDIPWDVWMAAVAEIEVECWRPPGLYDNLAFERTDGLTYDGLGLAIPGYTRHRHAEPVRPPDLPPAWPKKPHEPSIDFGSHPNDGRWKLKKRT